MIRSGRTAARVENKPKYAAKAHLTLPLYFKVLQELEAAKAVDPATRGRTFTLLPTKAGFTISHIPISSVFLMSVLKNMRKERFKGDGRDVDQDALWRNYFNVNLVETKVRKFGGSIVTDGCAVSVLLANAKTCIVCPEEPLDSGTLRILAHDRSGNVPGPTTRRRINTSHKVPDFLAQPHTDVRPPPSSLLEVIGQHLVQHRPLRIEAREHPSSGPSTFFRATQSARHRRHFHSGVAHFDISRVHRVQVCASDRKRAADGRHA